MLKKSTSFSVLITALTIAAAVLVAVPSPPAGAVGPASPNLFGISQVPGDWRGDIDDFAAETGQYPEIFELFWTLEMDLSSNWVAGMLDDTYTDHGQMLPLIEITTNSIGALNSGSRDGQLATLVDYTASWLEENPDHRVLIAPLPESNVSGHPWSGGPSAFKSGYDRIRDAFLNHPSDIQPSQIRFVFWMNGISSGYAEDYAPWYPGDDVVDILGFSKLNRGGNDWRDYSRTFRVHIEQMQTQVSPYKPILITQTGTVDVGGSKSQWLTEMMNGLPNEDQVIGVVYFNRLKSGNDFRIHPSGGSVRTEVKGNLDEWAPASEQDWIFDGSMDAWVQWRVDNLPDRLWGSNRYATAAAISQQTHPSSADVVYLAVGTNYPDAIAAGPAAAQEDAPILLVGQDTLPVETKGELERLQPSKIVVLGGPAAISDAVVGQVQQAVSGAVVVRLGGSNRYGTAVQVTQAVYHDPVDTVVVVTGENFPDALSAAPTGVVRGFPMLLVPPTSLPDVVADELRRLSPQNIILLGGTAAISTQVENALDEIAPTERIAATDRYTMSANLSERYFTPGVATVFIAVGSNFPDALAGGPAANVLPGPLLLVEKDSIPAAVAAELGRLDPGNIVILGGAAVVSVGVAVELVDYVP